MDVQLQELIDKIKKDGVASAENSAAAIIAEAEKKAVAIVAEAKAKATEIVNTGKNETARMEKASIDAIRQAGRNIILSFRDAINAELSALVTGEVSVAMSSDMVKKLVPEVVKAWAGNMEAEDISFLVPAKDAEDLAVSLRASLKDEMAKGLEVKADKSLATGFRIGIKEESVAELFSAYLNPKTAAIMKEAAASIGE